MNKQVDSVTTEGDLRTKVLTASSVGSQIILKSKKCAPIMSCNTRLSDHSALTVTITVITHPSFARSNYAQHPRIYKDKIGEAAEIAILSEAWSSATQ